MVVIYCEDGHFLIDEHDAFFEKENEYGDAQTTLELFDRPNDVRIDKFISVVDYTGDTVTIIRKSNSEISQIGIDLSAGGIPPNIIGSLVSPDFVVLYIQDGKERYIQLHMAKTSLKLIGALDSNILNYAILDLVLTKDMFYIFAVQEDPDDTASKKLLMLQIVYDAVLAGWM